MTDQASIRSKASAANARFRNAPAFHDCLVYAQVISQKQIDPMSEITLLLQAADGGDAAAVDRLFGLLYADLRRIAHAKLRQGGPTLLDTTALVHESYLRLINLAQLRVQDRSHFLAYAARVMRSVIVDMVRESRAERRGGGLALLTLDTGVANAAPAGDDEILAVHEALEQLAAIDARMVQVVEMRYFVGLEMDEIAQALGVGKRTVERDWEKARSYLYAALKRA
jgi:RNA polymerase sigma factor (TIGR02999 family)